jgi:tetratricopeptide (TPR) repeat protein
MQRYRVNYTVLFTILVGLFVGLGAVYGLWQFQVNRNAGSLIERAEKSMAAEDYDEAGELYQQYLSIKPEDEAIMVARANAWHQYINKEDNPRSEALLNSYKVMEDTVRKLPKQDELRRQVVDICMSRNFRLYSDALKHVQILLDNNPEDKDLMILHARCLTLSGNIEAESYSKKLIGFDPTTETFDETKAKAPNSAIIYRNLADLLREQRERPGLADRVMDQLVKANPDSYEAYLNRGQYYQKLDDQERAESDFRKAYELNPENEDVLLAMGLLYKDQENNEEAKRMFTVAKEKYPEDSRFYQQLADISMRNSKYDQALEEVNRGIKAVKKAESMLLLAYKADLQIRSADFKGVEETITEMRDSGFRPEYVDWIAARLMLSESKWWEASKALKKVRPLMSQFGGDIPSQIDLQLGLCHEKLGQLELARDAYEEALRRNTKLEPAMLGMQRVMSRLRIPDTADATPSFQTLIQEMRQLPDEQRDWTKLEQQVEELAEARQLSEKDRLLLHAEIMLMLEKYSAANELVQKAYELAPDDLRIRRVGMQVLNQDPDMGPAEALKFLEDRLISEFGDSLVLRVDKASLLIAINDVDLPQQLAALTEGIDDWSTNDKIQLWNALAGKYYQIGMRDEALRGWTKVTELAPNDLPTRLMLFSVAHDARDDASMQAAQKTILEVVDRGDPTYLYTEARRRLTLLRQGELAIEDLPAIIELVSTAAEERPDWDRLHLLRAEIAMINGDEDRALQYYQRASQLGRSPVGAIIQHVRLLVSRGRFEEAKLVVDRLPKATRQQAIGQLYAEILFNSDDVPAAITSAQLVVDQAPDNASKQLWYGQLMAKIAQVESLNAEEQQEADVKAGEAFRRSVDLDSSLQEAWLALISYHMYHKDRPNAEQALREAQLALSSERLPLMVAKCHEVMGRAFDAENLYRAVCGSNPDDLFATRQLAVFYLTGLNGYKRSQRIAKATPLVNAILKSYAEGKVPGDNTNVVWARRTAAQLLANTGDYQNLLKAEKLLASNSKNGLLPLTDRLQMAQILAPRPEPISRKKAMKLLQEAKEVDRLNVSAELMLGQLYYALGDWPRCRKQMLMVISRYPEVAQARANYIQMLLQRDSAVQAVRHLKKLMQLKPDNINTLDLIARVASETGKHADARQALLRTLPKDLNTLDDTELPRVEKIADLLVAELDDKETAFKLYRYLVTRDSAKVLKLAEFIGVHQEIEQCFALLDQVYTPESAPAVVQTAIKVVRAREKDAGNQFDDRILQWLDTALRRDPESIPLLMQQAEFNDVRQDYNEAANGYGKLLSRRDLRGRGRAIVLNNLAYLLALKDDGAKRETAIKLVREAVEILGPSPDILDTRAVVFIANKQFDDAIEDLELSVTDNPTAAKYFHKAVAHLGAGQNNDALVAWKEALKLGLTKDSIGRMERKRFDEVKSRIDKLQTTRQTASLGLGDPGHLVDGVHATKMPARATS